MIVIMMIRSACILEVTCVFSPGLTHTGNVVQHVSLGPLVDVMVVLEVRTIPKNVRVGRDVCKHGKCAGH